MKISSTTGCKCDICGHYFTSKDVYDQTYETIRTRRKTTLFIHKECIRSITVITENSTIKELMEMCKDRPVSDISSCEECQMRVNCGYRSPEHWTFDRPVDTNHNS